MILGNKYVPVRTRSSLKNDTNLMSLVSAITPSSINESLLDSGWILAMHDELNQFSRNDVWDQVPIPKGKHVIELNGFSKTSWTRHEIW